MKVYAVVNQAEYEGYDIVSVWTSKEKAAEIAIGYAGSSSYRKYYEYEVKRNEDGVYVMELDVQE